MSASQSQSRTRKADVSPSANSQGKRRVNLYDTVAGRVGTNGFLTPEQQSSSKAEPLSPEEVLLKSQSAPVEPAEGWYDANERRLEDQRLPDSDLAKAVHAYASDFYSRATHDHGQHDFKSFDETALLAMTILLEEAARESLGTTGDLALVEPEGLERDLGETKQVLYQIQGSVKPQSTPENRSEVSDQTDDEVPPAKKRRQ